MTMLEKITNAAWLVDRAMSKERYSEPPSRRERFDDWRIKLELAKTRAILEAMMTPDDGMLRAAIGWREIDPSDGIRLGSEADMFDRAWQAMLTAILNEGEKNGI